MAPTPASFERRYHTLRRLLDRRVAALSGRWASRDLDDACDYVMAAGGKRVRSIILLLSCEAVGGTVRDALPAGAAVEALHNFTLVHDDIMDHAPTRRGRPTVHVRWNLNTALLVGDVLLGLAYTALAGARPERRVLEVFTRGLLEVCDGQALDLEYERRPTVSVPAYYRMIEKKTACLLAMSAELGGLIGGGTERRVTLLRTFGLHLGRAFQLQDDLLDVFADEQEFGKSIGGDIVEGKRTFLLLTALERARGRDRSLLLKVMNRRPHLRSRADRSQSERRLIAEVTALYQRYGIAEVTRAAIRRDTARARAALRGLPPGDARAMLGWFADRLLHRNS